MPRSPALYRRDVRHAWLEGGPTLAAACWQAGLVDEVIAYVALPGTTFPSRKEY
jgi:riboflavin biosynthesis pyrimidine reductase